MHPKKIDVAWRKYSKLQALCLTGSLLYIYYIYYLYVYMYT